MIKVLLFAAFEEAVGQREVTLEETSLSVAQLKKKLASDYQGLPSLEHVMIAVNEEYVEEDTIIKANDTVAIIPPVSGG